MNLRRPIKILFHRASGATIAVPPLTRAQMAAAYALAEPPADAETARAEWDYRGRLLAIYLQHATCTSPAGNVQTPAEVIAELFPEEEVDIIQGVVAAQHGHDPEGAVELGQAMRELIKKKLRSGHETTSSPSTTERPATSPSS